MRWKPTLFLLLAAIGIGAYVSLIEVRWLTPEELNQQQRHLLSIAPEAIHHVGIAFKEAPIALQRENDIWTLQGYGRADEARIDGILRYTSRLMAQRALSLEETQGREAHFGFHDNAPTLDLHTRSDQYTLIFGEATALGTSRYVQLKGDPQIYILPTGLYELLDQELDTFRDPYIVHFANDKLKYLSITVANKKIALSHDRGRWKMTDPFEEVADAVHMNNWLKTLRQLTTDTFIAPNLENKNETLHALGLDPGIGTITLASKDAVNPIHITFGNRVEDQNHLRYAYRQGEDWVFTVNAEKVDALLVDQADKLRLERCFDFFTGEVDKVEITANKKTWHMERNQRVWVTPTIENPLDKRSVESFIEVLGELGIESFTDPRKEFVQAHYGLDMPKGQIKVWLTNNLDPQILTIGQDLLQGRKYWGYLEPRNVIVELPDLIEHLLMFVPADFKPLPAPTKKDI